jgi:hypothetical protein
MTKHLVILLLCLLPVVSARPQGRKPQNVYRVNVTSSHLLEGGEQTGSFYVVKQEIFDSLGRLHTEIDFTRETRYPDNYRWHYYDSMQLTGTDVFENEKIVKRIVFEYNDKGLLTGELRYGFRGEEPFLQEAVNYSYDPAGLPHRAVSYGEKGKRLYRIRAGFDESGTEIRRRVAGRRGEPSDGIARLDRKAEYDARGLLVSETLWIRMSDRNRLEYMKKYRHNEEGEIISVTRLDNLGNQLSRTEYDWQSGRNRLSVIRHYDGNDELTEYFTIRYEIYRSPDRRDRVIDY